MIKTMINKILMSSALLLAFISFGMQENANGGQIINEGQTIVVVENHRPVLRFLFGPRTRIWWVQPPIILSPTLPSPVSSIPQPVMGNSGDGTLTTFQFEMLRELDRIADALEIMSTQTDKWK